MASPGVEVGGVRLDVLVLWTDAMGVEDEFVRGEEQAADDTFNALGSG